MSNYSELLKHPKWEQKIAIGEWYEAIIYEKLLQLTSNADDYTVIAKCDDVPRRNRIRPPVTSTEFRSTVV